MKKFLILLSAALLLTFTLAGCGYTDYTGSAGAPDTNTNNRHDLLSSHTARVAIEEWYDGADMALELIYEDNYYRYYLSSIRSHLIMLAFEDGTRISLRNAISQNKIGMEDLLASGLQVIRNSAAEQGERRGEDVVSSSAMYDYVSSLPLQGVTSAKVQIRFAATEERAGEFAEYIPNELVDVNLLAAYQTFIEYGKEEQWDSGWRTVYTADTAVRDFRLIGLSYGFFLCEPTTNIYVREVIYTLDELSPELPLVASWVHEGCFTTGRGISFLYAGAARYFEIVHSNKSGHLFLREFTPG